MINTANKMRKEVRSEMRGGTGEITLTHLVEGADMLGKARIAARLSIPPGSTIGEHPHGPDAEIYIIEKGVAIVTDNGARHEMKAGDAMFIGGGDTHSLANGGDGILEVLAIVIE